MSFYQSINVFIINKRILCRNFHAHPVAEEDVEANARDSGRRPSVSTRSSYYILVNAHYKIPSRGEGNGRQEVRRLLRTEKKKMCINK